MKRHICSYDDLQHFKMRSFTVERTAIVLVRARDGGLYALRDVCPHKGPCLSAGMIDRSCKGEEAGEYVFEEEQEVLRCPWHSWEFDIRTGCSVFAPDRVKVRTYGVTVEDGQVYVDM